LITCFLDYSSCTEKILTHEFFADELVKAIDEDIRTAHEQLAKDDVNNYATHDFFSKSIPNGTHKPHHDIHGKL
jgi:hypothetical protein